jgi:hypothetical protein
MYFELKFEFIIPLGMEQVRLANWHSKVKAYHILLPHSSPGFKSTGVDQF